MIDSYNEIAPSHIKYLEAVKDQLEARLKGADHEVHRLRNVNEALMLNRAGASNLTSPPTFADWLPPSGNLGPRLIRKKKKSSHFHWALFYDNSKISDGLHSEPCKDR